MTIEGEKGQDPIEVTSVVSNSRQRLGSLKVPLSVDTGHGPTSSSGRLMAPHLVIAVTPLSPGVEEKAVPQSSKLIKLRPTTQGG